MLPYDAEALVALIESYNRVTWPAQLLALTLAAVTLVLLARSPRGARRVVAVVLVAAWAWTGVGYFAGFYAALNWAGWIYAAVFVTQALAIAWRGVVRPWPCATGHADGCWPGLALAWFALLGGPLLVLAGTGGIGAAQVVGLLPDATAVYTLGVLGALRAAPRWLWLAPLAWCGWSAWWWWQLQLPAAVLLPALGFAVTVLAWRLWARR